MNVNYEEQEKVSHKNSFMNSWDISKMRECMENALIHYIEIRGKKELEPKTFWDAVIISASDENQKKGYEIQLNEKKLRCEIPPNIPFHVFADPPGYKIGCGGSAMFVLHSLHDIYGAALFDMRLLLVPAGGHSVRLPHGTALGKLFLALPVGSQSLQLLDLLLATYLPLVQRMPPGVFLASSDALISYAVNFSDKWSFESDGFTALAHPSPISVGINHGVYVLPCEPSEPDLHDSAYMSRCLRVLQKPSVQEMEEKGAILNSRKEGDMDNGTVLSDSAFFFSHNVTQKLISFYRKNKPLKYELSSYGDFLQPLGELASPSYITKNTPEEESKALLQSALYRKLFGTRLTVLVLKNSMFHHLGTLPEYLDSLSFKNHFGNIFCIQHQSMSLFSPSNIASIYIEGTVLCSVVHPMSTIPEDSLLEYCNLRSAVQIGHRCILSRLCMTGVSVQRLPIPIPDGTFMHTVAVVGGFVTIACHVDDDLKQATRKERTFEIKYFGKRLTRRLAPGVDAFPGDCYSYSLWTMQMFPIRHSPEDSFLDTLKLVTCPCENTFSELIMSWDEECISLLSMQDVLAEKDVERMLKYNRELLEIIEKQK